MAATTVVADSSSKNQSPLRKQEIKKIKNHSLNKRKKRSHPKTLQEILSSPFQITPVDSSFSKGKEEDLPLLI
jgi:hypothetical protein